MVSKWGGAPVVAAAALLSSATVLGHAQSQSSVIQETPQFAHVQFSCGGGGCLFFDTRTGDLWLWGGENQPFKHMGRLVSFFQPLAEHPRMAAAAENAYVETMKSDLRNLVTAQEAFFANAQRYATDLGGRFLVSSGVTGPTITLTRDGWTATVGHQRSAKKCAIYVGTTPLAPATKEGAPACN